MQKYQIILVGNTNVGKTTFLNTIAGVNQETSNYPGTTVEIFKTNVKYNEIEFKITDLPGTYSLTTYTEEEKVTKDFLLNEQYDLIVQIIDPQAKKRSLAFTLELMELDIPIFIVVNNIQNNCQKADFFLQTLKEKLEIEGMVINASHKNTKRLFFNALKKFNTNSYQNICKQIQPSLKKENKNYNSMLQQNRYDFIEKNLCPYISNTETNQQNSFDQISHKLDKIFLNSFIGLPVFLVLMWIMFQTTFTLGAIPMNLIDLFFASIQNKLTLILPTNLWSSILIDGIIGGVGATLVFLPNIIILVFFLALLKQSGYLARTAYLLDHLMQKIGLGGRSFVPLLMGFGCNVPAIMATRTLSSRRERIITSLMIPFMTCGARLPIYSLFIAAFFEEKWRGTILFGLYFFGVLLSFLTGFIFKRIITDRKRPLLLELPVYRLPQIKKIGLEVWFSAKSFLIKAGKVILPFSILLWVLFTFPQNNQKTPSIQNSYASQIGQTISPVFEPLGFDWRITTGLIAGLGAKEVLISTFGTLSSLENTSEDSLILSLKNDPVFTKLTVISLLAFVLIYTPCIAVIGVFRQEFGTKWATVALLYPTFLAWIISFLIYQIGTLIINN